MTRIKHIVKQVILNNNSFNARSKLVKTTRMKITRKERFIEDIKSLLNDVDRKSRRYKSEST
jgi:hypothetical protein